MENDKYDAAQQRIQKWLSEGVFSKDAEPAVYVSRQEFRLPEGVCTRTGLIAAVRLSSYEEGTVFPHEVTYKEPKTDRLNMLRAVQKDLEPVFLIYSDPEKVTIDFTMVEAMSSMGRILGLETIGEYAKNGEIIGMLRNIGVDYAQGYGIAEPRPLSYNFV